VLETIDLDRDLATLRGSARAWVVLPLPEKLELLHQVREATGHVAQQWVQASCAGKQISPHAPVAGEEWMSGPYALITGVAALADTLGDLVAGRDPLRGVRAQRKPGGRVATRVFPVKLQDQVLMGHKADVWLRPGVSLDEAREGVARRLRDTTGPGEVALVLGAGNINSIAPLDALGKLYGDNAVVMIKLNPVNAYLEPILGAALEPLVERGFVRITSGGADVGGYLVNHAEVDSIHITGSAASHDAIVFGPGELGATRKLRGEPLVTKPIASELGGVGPVIVVPGKWSDRMLRAQARHVVTQRLHNSGFNCVATQVVVLPESWPQADTFVGYLRDAMRDAPDRPAYYPGAAARQRAAADRHLDCELLGGDPTAPRTLLLALDAKDSAEPAFTEEYFGPVLGVTSLPGVDAAEFLDAAVDFCNDQVAGTLGVNVLAAPKTMRALGTRFDGAIARLRYGTIAINTWVAPIFAMPRGTWGAFPGNDITDVGSGIGVVHNALLLDPDHVERTVGRGPFRQWPKPLWFVTHRTADVCGQQMTRFAAEPNLLKAIPHVLATFAAAVRG